MKTIQRKHKEITEKVDASIFKPMAMEKNSDLKVADWIGSADYQRFKILNFYHYLVKNYLIGSFLQGTISEIELNKMLNLSQTEHGLEQIAAHAIINIQKSKKEFTGHALIKPFNPLEIRH